MRGFIYSTTWGGSNLSFNNTTVDHLGHLQIGGCDVVDLADQYGTPLYIFDEETVIENVRQYQQALSALPETEIIYASKALLTVGIAKLMYNLGLSLDVVSGGELYIALQAGFDPGRIYFHGNNKSIEELVMALNAGVGRFVVDNLHELYLLSELAKQTGQTANILVRIMPGVEAHTHSYIQTGQLDSKFGISILHNQAHAALTLAAELPNISLKGIHCHIGSQIFEVESYAATVDVMFNFIAEMREQGIKLQELDLGGGLGIKYLPDDPAVPIRVFGDFLVETIRNAAEKYHLPLPKIMIEPGRSLIGAAGTTIYRIGSIKQHIGGRTYAAVDGGMGDNPRVALYQAKYHAIVANKANQQPESVYTVVGKYCESGDVLIHNIALPHLEAGDLLAVFSTGAYNYSMSSNYNAVPRPPIVTVYRGESEVVVERETYADLIRLHRIPDRWLQLLKERSQ